MRFNLMFFNKVFLILQYTASLSLNCTLLMIKYFVQYLITYIISTFLLLSENANEATSTQPYLYHAKRDSIYRKKSPDKTLTWMHIHAYMVLRDHKCRGIN